jgi:hypothetical protein
MIEPKYITKAGMIDRYGDYFGITHFEHRGAVPGIYIREDLPECVKKSVLAHERHHARGNHSEFGAWIAGAKGHFGGFLLGILMSLRPGRLKLYPKTVSAVMLVIVFGLLIYSNS